MSEIMTAKELCLWYGDNKALKDINIAIPERSITALIGPSGCGKSTFLKTLNRMNDLIPIVKITGEVCYNGRNIFDKDVDVNELRRDVGMVFQKPNPFPMSIYDNIAYGPRTHGITSKVRLDEIVEQALRDAAIWDEVKDRLKKNALGFSGGQQQRLCIARALAVEPKVLLMDEPTSALDPISTSRIEDATQNRQAVFVRHCLYYITIIKRCQSSKYLKQISINQPVFITKPPAFRRGAFCSDLSHPASLCAAISLPSCCGYTLLSSGTELRLRLQRYRPFQHHRSAENR